MDFALRTLGIKVKNKFLISKKKKKSKQFVLIINHDIMLGLLINSFLNTNQKVRIINHYSGF